MKTFNKTKNDLVVKQPTPGGLNAIINACQLRKDYVYETLWPIRDDILNLNIKVAFHKSCRTKYTSKSNLPKSDCADHEQQCGASVSTQPSRLSRTETSGFDIQRDCFICGKTKNKGEKLTPLTTGTGQNTREKVLLAAEERQDQQIHMQMLCYPDLFAYDARYHRTCYSH